MAYFYEILSFCLEYELNCSSIKMARFKINGSLFCVSYLLRIDTGGWSVICCALFHEVPTKCSLANYHTLCVIK